jgi:hypothetical protein
MQNRGIQNCSTKIIIALAAATARLSAFAGSYTVDIPASTAWPLGWSFQPTTVSNAFPTANSGTTLYFWNADTTGYVNNVYISGWSNPSYVISNGVGFYYQDGGSTGVVLTVSGKDLTTTNVTFPPFGGGKAYFLASAYLQPNNAGNFVECCSTNTAGLGSFDFNLNYHDEIYIWNTSTLSWVGGMRTNALSCTNCTSVHGSPFWVTLGTNCAWAWGPGQSAKTAIGQGFWYYPISNITWIQYSNEFSCPTICP